MKRQKGKKDVIAITAVVSGTKLPYTTKVVFKTKDEEFCLRFFAPQNMCLDGTSADRLLQISPFLSSIVGGKISYIEEGAAGAINPYFVADRYVCLKVLVRKFKRAIAEAVKQYPPKNKKV